MLTQNEVNIISFMRDRLIEHYKESPNTDYLIKARAIIGKLQSEVVVKKRKTTPKEKLDFCLDWIKANCKTGEDFQIYFRGCQRVGSLRFAFDGEGYKILKTVEESICADVPDEVEE